MSIGAAKAKGADGRLARTTVEWVPVLEFGVDIKRTVGEINVPVRLREIKRRRQLPVLRCEQDFDDAGDSGSGQGVTDVGLDRAECAELSSWSVTAEGVGQGLYFNGIAESG